MKLALVFLLAFVALSCQQQLQKRMIWMSPYAPPRAYNNIPSYYGNRLYPGSPMMGRYYFNQPMSNPAFHYVGAIQQQQQHPILQQLGSRYYSNYNSYFSPSPNIIQVYFYILF